MTNNLKTFLKSIEPKLNKSQGPQSSVDYDYDDELSLEEMNEIWGTNFGSDEFDPDDCPGAR